MGTWSSTAFGNDVAADWAYELEEQADFVLVTEALKSVLDVGTDYLDMDTGSSVSLDDE